MSVQEGISPSPSTGDSGRVSLVNNPRVRGFIFQLITAIIIAVVLYIFVTNAQTNLRSQGIATGFGFLDQPASFDVNQSLIEFTQNATYGRVLLVGILNTLLVAAVGIILATIIGFMVGIARLSPNWMVRTLGTIYVEVTRNLPPLFQIFFWYVVLIKFSPSPRDSFSLFNAFFYSNRGLYMPSVVLGNGAIFIELSIVIAVVLALVVRYWARKRQEQTGEQFPVLWTAIGLIIGLPLIVSAIFGFPITFDVPELGGFNFRGGTRVIPEFVALTWALSIYTAGFIAEIVRAGIMAVSHGQTEAAGSLGLRPGPTLRLVVIPQAMRVIIPPLTSQYLNLTKNSSLAVAVGYPEITAIFAGTTLNQTGQAIEVIAITMCVYLTISIVTSIFMNWYNRRVALVER
ncbi:amino acid ABC transporter permease [Agaricicola taiwanensis]|uniref:Amino acid ABC transporter permease n=1 Tax=Agaricicola taiwanensis TaxID=591372 RepID=A0A8J3DX94_9RHOB|nr:amino acid ABC transporter permease [Agaricicola taiwanensis]GGE45200.1 amino acid ABC transporter permease [Agaricicola taiwanensis]